jgi:hypothetical protein
MTDWGGLRRLRNLEVTIVPSRRKVAKVDETAGHEHQWDRVFRRDILVEVRCHTCGKTSLEVLAAQRISPPTRSRHSLDCDRLFDDRGMQADCICGAGNDAP